MLEYAIMLILVGVLESIVRRRYDTWIYLVELFGRVLKMRHARGSVVIMIDMNITVLRRR